MTKEQKVYSSDYDDYNFSDTQKVGSIQIEKEITQNEIESVMVNSMEGGSNYWIGIRSDDEVWKKKPKGIPYSTWATQMLIDGETLTFFDYEVENGETFFLTLEKLLNGIKLNYINRPWDNNIEDGDASTADCIIQYALFDKVVYG